MIKRLSVMLTAAMLATAINVAAQQNPCNPCAKKPKNPCADKVQNPCAGKPAKGKERTVLGYIGDSQCGLEHPMAMGDAKTCTLKCIDGGGKFVLADRDHKIVYSLDDAAQEKAREFAGQKVKVTGHVDAKAKSIHVTKIEAAG
ncbi:MAG TPA: DUF5818 domain-containing protein [Blastocatellia bacterium]|nr:DUF5818 domain-containing protein [Blastocatellia bacterium]